MRLIDADALLAQVRQIDFLKEPNSTKLSACEIMKIINAQPTAYDVDKVVEELKQQAEQYRRRGFEHEQKGYSSYADKFYGKQSSYLNAIEIVKAGGAK